MKKFIFGIIAFFVIGCVVVSLVRYVKGDDKSLRSTDGKTIADYYESATNTLSDKDIYFKADTVLPDNPVVNDMMDVANGYAILRAAYCDAELWFEFGEVVNDKIVKLRTDIIKDPDMRRATERYVRYLALIMPADTIQREDNDSLLWEQLWDAFTAYADELKSRYALSRYGQITEEDVRRYMDVTQFISNYDSIYDLRRRQWDENERFLELKALHAPDFDTKCLYTVEYAHQRRYEKSHPAIPLMEELMESGKFSRYLHEVWRTWRVLKQADVSPHKNGEIRNREYNKMRFRCLNIILKRIIKNPQDIYAINDFCYLATYDNITRYTEYSVGNSVFIEHMQLFPEILEESNDEEDSQ